MSRGFLFIISGPSGAGKGTLARRLDEALDDVVLSISCTTRPPRKGEVDKIHYFFLTEQDFIGKIQKGEFLECAKVHEKWMYGTPESFVREHIDEGNAVILEIDVQGYREVMETDIDKVSVFISPSDPDVLRKRVRDRAPISEEELERRMRVADEEYDYATLFDYIIVNDDLETAVTDIISVVRAERVRACRNEDKIKEIIRRRGIGHNA